MAWSEGTKQSQGDARDCCVALWSAPVTMMRSPVVRPPAGCNPGPVPAGGVRGKDAFERGTRGMFPSGRVRRGGYTLLEMITVIVIVGVIASVTLPELSNFYSGDVVTGEAMVLINNIRRARYRAMEQQTVHRIVFSDDLLSYKVEVFNGLPAAETGAQLSSFADTNWLTVIDTDIAEFSPSISVSKDPSLPNCVFFFPNGKAVTRIDTTGPVSEANTIGIPEGYIMLTYGNAGIRIVLNAYGVFASEAYAPDDDVSDDDAVAEIW